MPRPRNADFLEYHTRRAQQEGELIKDILTRDEFHIRYYHKDLVASRKRKKYHEKMVREQVVYNKWKADGGLK